MFRVSSELLRVGRDDGAKKGAAGLQLSAGGGRPWKFLRCYQRRIAASTKAMATIGATAMMKR